MPHGCASGPALLQVLLDSLVKDVLFLTVLTRCVGVESASQGALDSDTHMLLRPPFDTRLLRHGQTMPQARVCCKGAFCG